MRGNGRRDIHLVLILRPLLLMRPRRLSARRRVGMRCRAFARQRRGCWIKESSGRRAIEALSCDDEASPL